MKAIDILYIILLPVIFIFSLMITGCNATESEKSKEAGKSMDNRVEVIYFHGKMRCSSCKAMEKYASEAVDSLFKDELKAGKVIFRTVDIQDNEAMADDYQVTGSSLFITSFSNGKESRKDMTEFGFKTARKHPGIFQDSVSNVIREFLNHIKQ